MDDKHRLVVRLYFLCVNNNKKVEIINDFNGQLCCVCLEFWWLFKYCLIKWLGSSILIASINGLKGFPEAINTISPDAIESLNNIIHHATKKRNIFPSDDSVKKAVYLAIISASQK